MILIAALGNPGAAYAHNRHNIGYRALDAFAAQLASQGTAPRPLQPPNRTQAELAKAGSLLLCKPLTYMNASGEAIAPIARFYKCERIIVLHDEMELAFGRLKLQKGGSHAGHNGLKSVQKHCGGEYERLRLGIGRPAMPRTEAGEILPLSGEELAGLNHSARAHIDSGDAPRAQRILSWVLGDFAAREEAILREEFLPRAADALGCLIAEGLERAQNAYNR